MSKPSSDLKAIVVIPCFKEKDLIKSLQSLEKCDLETIKGEVEVITVINHSEKAAEDDKQLNQKVFEEASRWIEETDTKFNHHLIKAFDLSKKHAGVGLARKIGMDEAVDRLHQIDNLSAPIICFDADSSCSINYLTEVINFFDSNIKAPGCSIHFEHPLEGDDFSRQIYDGILFYELFLRYYVQGLRFANYPFAYHTIGSSMAVRADVYAKQGGMNRRKAGEDFYFLHKIMPLGNFGEVLSAKVIPSPRTSDRVPFGTGKAISNWIDENKTVWNTYDPKTFILVREVVALINKAFESTSEDITKQLEELNKQVAQHLIEDGFIDEIERAKNNSSNASTFLGQFYSWFNGLKVLKLVHFIRDHIYPEVEVCAASNGLLEMLGETSIQNNRELLIKYRELDLKGDQKENQYIQIIELFNMPGAEGVVAIVEVFGVDLSLGQHFKSTNSKVKISGIDVTSKFDIENHNGCVLKLLEGEKISIGDRFVLI